MPGRKDSDDGRQKSELYGVIEAQRRYRGWMPFLRTLGQRAVFGCLLGFMSLDGNCTPTAPQIASECELHVQAVRKILRQLEEEVGCVMRMGSRANLSSDGVARGSRIPIRTFPPAPTDSGGDSQLSREPIPPAPKAAPTRASGNSPLKVEELKGIEGCAKCDSNGFVERLDEEGDLRSYRCKHRA